MNNERTVKLTLEKAREWYKAGGELKEVALQAFKETELNPLPRSWEDFCENYPIGDEEKAMNIFGEPIVPDEIQHSGTRRIINTSFDVLPDEEYVKAFVALMKLVSLRKVWVGDWEPNWKDTTQKYCILFADLRSRIGEFSLASRPLSFPTKEMAEDFLNTFKDLIEQAKILL